MLGETNEIYEPSDLPEMLAHDVTELMKKEHSKKYSQKDIEVRGVIKLNESMKKHT